MEIFKLFGTILIDNDKANQSLKKTDEQAQSSGGKMTSSFKKVAAAVGTYLSVKAVADFGKACINAYNEAAEAEKKLTVIMKQRFNASDESIQSIMDLTTAQQKLGVVEDDVQKAGAQQLSTFLTNDEALKSLIPSMNDLAVQQNGCNVTSEKMVNIGNLMGKVMQGQTGALKRVGISFDANQEKVLKYGTEQEKAAMLAQVITDNVGHMNEEFAKTDSGKIQQAKNNFGDLQEKIGGYLVPVLGTLAGWFNTIVILITDNLDPALSSVGSFFNEIGRIFNENTGGMSNIWNTIGKPIFDGFMQIVNDLKIAWDIIFPAIQVLWSSFLATLGVFWDTVGLPIFNTIMNIVTQVATFFHNNFQTISLIVSDCFTIISRYWTEILQPIFTAIGAFISNVLAPIFITEFQRILNAVQIAFSFIANLWDTSLKPILNGIVDFISGVFSGNWSTAWSGIAGILGGVWEGLKSILWSPIQWLLDKVFGFGAQIAAPFSEAAAAIGNIWQSIKSLFKLPHFNFSGSVNPIDWIMDGELPSIGVEWYAKGGIMSNPSLFGMNPYTGKMMGGGEKGDEAIAPISKLEEYYKKWNSQASSDPLFGEILKELKLQNSLIVNLFAKCIDAIKALRLIVGDKEVYEAFNRAKQRTGLDLGI